MSGSAEELETERLRLRPFRRDDLDAVARWNSDPRVMRYMGRGPMSREESEEALDRYLRHWERHGFGLWLAEHRESGEPVGRIGLAYHRTWPDDPEVGWTIDPRWWGRGLAAEGGAAAVRHGFDVLGVPRIVSITIEANLASLRVMEKLGLRFLTEVEDAVTGLALRVHVLDRPEAAPRLF